MKPGHTLPPDKGTYILIFRMLSGSRISVGRLGEFFFPRGHYLYVGSAFGSGGLAARLRHHLSRSVSPRWHVDYLKLTAVLKHFVFACSAEHLEHQWATLLSHMDELETAVKRFGSSDCHCRTHLFYNRCMPLPGLVKMITQRLSADGTIVKVTSSNTGNR